MKKKDPDFNVMGINPELVLMLKGIQERKDSGEIFDPETMEALNAIDVASKIVNTIMNGNQIDPVFLKQYIDNATNRINNLSGDNNPAKGKVKKKRKFKRKK